MRLLINTAIGGLLFLALFGFSYAWGLNASGKEHGCKEPCVVTFDQPMEEDEFAIDYYDGKLRVWRVVPE